MLVGNAADWLETVTFDERFPTFDDLRLAVFSRWFKYNRQDVPSVTGHHTHIQTTVPQLIYHVILAEWRGTCHAYVRSWWGHRLTTKEGWHSSDSSECRKLGVQINSLTQATMMLCAFSVIKRGTREINVQWTEMVQCIKQLQCEWICASTG